MLTMLSIVTQCTCMRIIITTTVSLNNTNNKNRQDHKATYNTNVHLCNIKTELKGLKVNVPMGSFLLIIVLTSNSIRIHYPVTTYSIDLSRKKYAIFLAQLIRQFQQTTKSSSNICFLMKIPLFTLFSSTEVRRVKGLNCIAWQ